ncbi:hypothetical protein [Dyadobacter sp. 3J3]|uniref:hypothetical protein n=1 Tax=Dyadobacter sp. 3J3 TaxID=2606600 RepID=UPI00135AA78E|nr:hypothetical protein [Dyadobacter sp. 3J3]
MRKYFLSLLLLVAALPIFSQSVITYPSSGNIATEEWVQNYLFDQLEKYNISDCDLRIDTIVQEGSAIEIGLTVSLQNLNNYSIRIVKGEQTWFWNAVPYTVGERMRIEGVPRLDSVRITIRPTLHPTCYVGFNYNLGGGDNPDPTDPTDPSNPNPTVPCASGPTLLTITNVQATALTATFHGNGVFEVLWRIKNGAGATIRSGNLTPTSSTLNFTYSAIPYGNYTLDLIGTSCIGSSSKTFVYQDPGGIDPGTPPVQNNVIPAFSQVPKLLVTISNVNGVYSDNTADDYQESGITYRNANGRKYRALYWLNEVPWKNSDNSIKSFKNVTIPNGILLTVRKEYADVNWAGSNSHTDFKNRGWDIWLHANENPNADGSWLLATAVTQITTNNGVDLNTGSLVRDNNPSWLDASKYVPQFYFNPSSYSPDKPVTLHAFPAGNTAQETADHLSAGGINHLWWQNLHGAGIYTNGAPTPGVDTHGILPSFNLSSTDYYNIIKGVYGIELTPYGGQATCEQARTVADGIFICEGCVYTDEFTEGLYPQFAPSRECFYQRFNERVAALGYTKVQLLGDYGYGSQNVGLNGKDPLGSYALSLTNSNVVNNLENVDGSNNTGFKQYAQGAYNYRGTVIGDYYAITGLSPARGTAKFWEALVTINATPNKAKMLFATDLMQSNAHGADVPYKDSGTLLANGSISYDYPDTPAEIMKFDAFFSLLVYDSWYYWQAFGAKKVSDIDWRRTGICLDAGVVGSRMYARLIPTLNQAGRQIYACDYTANGVPFTSSTTERRLPIKGVPRYDNRYFNEALAANKGVALCIPGTKKAFFYYNTNIDPSVIETVIITYNGVQFNLGQVAGSTMVVAYEP